MIKINFDLLRWRFVALYLIIGDFTALALGFVETGLIWYGAFLCWFGAMSLHDWRIIKA